MCRVFYAVSDGINKLFDNIDSTIGNIGNGTFNKTNKYAGKVDDFIKNNLLSICAGLTYIFAFRAATIRFLGGIALAALVKHTDQQPDLTQGILPRHTAMLATAGAIIHMIYIAMFPLSFPVFWPGAILVGVAAFDTIYRSFRYFRPAPAQQPAQA